MLAPYQPALVGAHPLGIAPTGTPVEIVCRATDLPAFARVRRARLRRLARGSRSTAAASTARRRCSPSSRSTACRSRSLPSRSTSTAASERRRSAIDRVLARVATRRAGQAGRRRSPPATTGSRRRRRPVRPLAHGARVARERESGPRGPGHGRCRRPGPDVREYVIAVALGVAAEVLIVAAGAARGSQEYTGLMLMLAGRRARRALRRPAGAAWRRWRRSWPWAPLIASSITVGSESCSPDCGQQSVSYLFVAVLVAAAAGDAPACCATGTSRARRDPGARRRSAPAPRGRVRVRRRRSGRPPRRPVRIALLEPSAPLVRGVHDAERYVGAVETGDAGRPTWS